MIRKRKGFTRKAFVDSGNSSKNERKKTQHYDITYQYIELDYCEDKKCQPIGRRREMERAKSEMKNI